MERVLLSFERFGEIEITPQPIGNGEIRLQKASQHFLIELLLEGFRGLQNGVGIRVLGLQIDDDFRIFFLPQPGVMVHTAVAMHHMLYRFPAGNRRLGNRGCRDFLGWQWRRDIGVRVHTSLLYEGCDAANVDARNESGSFAILSELGGGRKQPAAEYEKLGGKRNGNQTENQRRARVSSRVEAHGSASRLPGHFQGSRGKCNFRYAPGRTCQARPTATHSDGNTRSPGESNEGGAEAARDPDL